MGPRKQPHCAVTGCDSKYDGRISFFRFPKTDKERCTEWLRLCGKLELMGKEIDFYYNKLRVCAKHFRDDMFANYLKDRLLPHATPVHLLPATKNKITGPILILFKSSSSASTPTVEDIKPTLNCSRAESPLELHVTEEETAKPKPLVSSVGTQTPASLSSNNTPRKAELRMKLRSQQKRITGLEQKQEVSVEEFKSLCDKFLPKKVSEWTKIQVDLKNNYSLS